MTEKRKQNNMRRMGLHLSWLYNHDKAKWDGAMFALEVMGYKVEVNEDGNYVVAEA